MAKSMTINGTKAMFNMSLKGGDLPDSFEIMLNVEMDFEGATMAQFYECCAGGSSARVKLQSRLRKMTVAQLRVFALEGYKCKFVDLMTGAVQRDYKTALAALPYDEFIETVMRDLQTKLDVAQRYYKLLTGNDIPVE